jgi:hypothetical protein
VYNLGRRCKIAVSISNTETLLSSVLLASINFSGIRLIPHS